MEWAEANVVVAFSFSFGFGSGSGFGFGFGSGFGLGSALLLFVCVLTSQGQSLHLEPAAGRVCPAAVPALLSATPARLHQHTQGQRRRQVGCKSTDASSSSSSFFFFLLLLSIIIILLVIFVFVLLSFPYFYLWINKYFMFAEFIEMIDN
jgi:hypothetical protein